MLPADLWMRKIFDAKAARAGGVVRRSVRDIERIVGRERFRREITRRGYHAVENAGQVEIFCNNERVSVWC
ncbi:hypothetical protein FIU89_09180 [Roseovarius sp. THAF27]|nr:hypothetical protein FIU89_09180 [Roseovarius sp. THAF27]